MATGDRRALRHGAKVQIDGYGTVVLDSLDDLPQVKANLDKKFEEVRGFVDTFWGGLSKEDKAAIAVAPVPVLGDAVGLYADAVNYISDPDSRNWLNYTLTLASVLPLVPSATQMRAAKQAKKAINAWHGSPHKFDRFSLEKIGTGEGAQAYGHGLYFAENPKVAKDYQRALGQRGADGGLDLGSIDGVSYADMPPGPQKTALTWINTWQDPNLAAKKLADAGYADAAEVAQQVADGSKSLKIKRGALYNVDLDVDPDTLLDWDAPFDKQPEKVKQAARELGYLQPAEYTKEQVQDMIVDMGPDANPSYRYQFQVDGDTFMSGESPESVLDRSKQWYEEATDSWVGADTGRRQSTGGGQSFHDWVLDRLAGRDQGKAAKILRESGVPGLRYYDGVSRGAGEGTRNYVIFDDSLVNIKSVE